MGINLNEHAQAVISHLTEKFNGTLHSIEEYPDEFGSIQAPCAFFGVLDWERAEEQRMTGELTVDLNCQLLIVFGQDGTVSQNDVRNRAMGASLFIDDQNFGLDAEPARFISAQPFAFDPDLEQYVVWSVDFKQEIDIGVDQFDAVPDFQPTGIFLRETVCRTDEDPGEYVELT
ncbi:hypothetical protein [Marinomonas atlantica]|uniref:hypothetical protein n=1 Tax=Marinomonas atlantica TaxID=1806668 RepID=UPI0008297F8D|nr:hypothetical protein [Marinomonas atlantica]